MRVRADALRNRDRILDAARELVTEVGADATMEDIARRAGVAVGTLYRHFPTKEHLVGAAVEDSFEQLAVLSEAGLAEIDAGAAPGPVLAGLFREVARRYATDRALKAATGRLGVTGPPVAAVVGMAAELEAAAPGSPTLRAMTAITEVVGRAVAAGAVRGDVTVDDLAVLLDGVPGPEVPEDLRARYIEIVIAGLTTRADT